jgi:hypothetical protein
MPIADLHAYRIDKLYRDVPELDGMYFDIMHCRTCENEHHGCGGIDAFGQKYKTSYALNTRAYILRVLKIHQKHRKHFSLHAHNAFFPFVHDLCSVWMPGEELFEPIAKNPFWGYFEAVSEEAYQAAWSNVIRGVWIDQIPQQARIVGQMPHLAKDLKEKLRSFKYAARATYPTFLYDFTQRSYASERPGHPIYKGWDIRKDAKFGLADFHAYWVDPATVSAAPVKVSWYSWKKGTAPYPFMLCAVNTGRKDVKANLVIDWKKLKSKPCRLKDLWGGKVFTEKELASYVMEGQSMLLLVPAGETR